MTIALLAACGADEGSPEMDTPQMMAAALEQLITVDHTFGDGPPPFTVFLVQTSTDPGAGVGQDGAGTRRLTGEERDAIEEALSAHGDVRWVDDPNEWRTEDLVPTLEGSVILGVGEPTADGEGGLVPVSLWCGGLCGTWFTYALDLVDGVWTVTGIEGPVAIS